MRLQFGPIDSTVILVEKGGTGLSRGCAFVNFSTYKAAMASIAALDNQVILPGGPYNLRVSSGHSAERALRTCPQSSVWPNIPYGSLPKSIEMGAGALRQSAWHRVPAPALRRPSINAERSGPPACVLHARPTWRGQGDHRGCIPTLRRGRLSPPRVLPAIVPWCPTARRLAPRLPR